MLLNDFYTCQDIVQHDESFSALVIFNVSHDIFKGHFPGQPVVPGVCMMEMVKELLQQQLNTKLKLQTAGNVKFLQLITPDSQPTLTINWNTTDNGYWVSAAFRSDSSTLFKLEGKYVVL